MTLMCAGKKCILLFFTLLRLEKEPNSPYFSCTFANMGSRLEAAWLENAVSVVS